MTLYSGLISKLQTGKGLLFFLVIWTFVWVCGYYAIDFMTKDDWTRYIRQLYFSRATLIVTVILLIIVSVPHFRDFLSNTRKTATDLAVFRVLFFGFFAVGLVFNPSIVTDQVEPFLNLPSSAQVPLPWMSWYPKIVPINATVVFIASILFYISIFTSLLGIKTRWSILIFTVTLFYLFMIPNLFGKVNHNHHLIWFPAILAFSPCADRFSLDAYFRRRQKKVIHHSAAHYTLPFILIWILIGLIYFFPGFWKVWSHGLDWTLTDNVRNQMYYKWFQLSDVEAWTPFFRIDQYPLLYKTSGLYTIMFELSFIPLILNKSTRKIGIAMGLVFHFATFAFMYIFFIVLVWSYLSFVNWNGISFLKERGNMSTLKPSNFDHTMVKWIGGGLIFFCLVFGFGKWYSYPFTVYPTFDTIVEEEINHLNYVGEMKDGSRVELPITPLHDEYTSPRYWEMEYDIIQSIETNKLDTALLNRFATIFTSDNPQIQQVLIYNGRESIIPEKRLKNVRMLIYSTPVE